MRKQSKTQNTLGEYENWINDILIKFQHGELKLTQAVSELSNLPYEDITFAKVDHHRTLRKGFPEVIFGLGKTEGQIVEIAKSISKHSPKILITRVGIHTYKAIKSVLPDAVYNKDAKAIIVNRIKHEKKYKGIVVVTGGTADISVAEEAAVTAELMGNRVQKIYDIGVAGIHRLFAHLPILQKANVIIAVAGMDGVLPSIVGGLVQCPVIAVPTNTGYGANFNGISPLLTMLNCCAPGVGVVNIDAGFNAGYLAGLINKR